MISSFFVFFTHLLSSFWTSRGHRCRPFSPRLLPSINIAHRVQQSQCSSIFHRVLLTHALALSASQFVHNKKSPRICAIMHSGGFELTKLTYTRLEDNLIRHRGDRRYNDLFESKYFMLHTSPPVYELHHELQQTDKGLSQSVALNRNQLFPGGPKRSKIGICFKTNRK